MSTPLPKLIAVLGPTASGKTDIALSIARKFRGEIIVADSRQIYKGVDIASNKVVAGEKQGQTGGNQGSTSRELRGRTLPGPDPAFVEGVAYHGLDLVKPDEVLTVQQWKTITLTTIEKIRKRKHLPIIEGGTGLYVQALLDNYDFPDAPPDMALRKQLARQLEVAGLASLVDELLRKDPDVTRFLDIENPRRVIRALEVIEVTGEPFSKQRTQSEKLFNDLRIGIERSMTEIDDRIEERAQEQAMAGLEEEAKTMLKRYGATLPAMTSIGYSEWLPYFNGEISRDDVIDKNIRRNKRLARAQLKWFKRDPEVHWIKSTEEALDLAKEFLT